MGFPVAYQFIENAFMCEYDMYKDPNKFNPLIDDISQTKMEIGKKKKP